MKNKTISDIFQFQSRFLRSANLERDFRDAKTLNGYIITPQIEESLNSILNGLEPESGKRAWRIIGDFGSGKSSFALFLANLFSERFEQIPKRLRDSSGYKKARRKHPNLLPILITGSRESLSFVLTRTLIFELKDLDTSNILETIIDKLESSLRSDKTTSLSDDELISLLVKANKLIRTETRYKGLLIIIDELGKFLEYSTLNPDKQDIYLLQQLAEVSVRSKDTPLLFIGLLHQGFSNYTDYLTPTAQREWEKVSNRFQQISFNYPLEQIVGLIGSALNISKKDLSVKIREQAQEIMQKALSLGWYGFGLNENVVYEAPNLYPIHSTVLPILIEVFSRFGQHQRSLFSFLMSDEPFGLMEFSSQSLQEANFYRLHNLYDYVRTTFGNSLSLQSYRTQWNLIESLIESFPSTENLELQILKTVGLLNLINSQKFLATEEAIIASVLDEKNGVNEARIKQTIKKLQRDILHNRGSLGGYCLWAYTSVNLDVEYEKAKNALSQISFQKVSSILETYINPRPIVARRHYIETGNLRHFEVVFSSIENLRRNLNYDLTEVDGRIVVALCETSEEREEAMEIAKKTFSKKLTNLIIAVPRPLEVLSSLFQEVQRWEWISQNAPLGSDKYASQEVERHLSASQHSLDKRIQSAIGLYQFSDNTYLEWFHLGKNRVVSSNRELLEFISDLCDTKFSLAPKIHNELINRREPSGVANKARNQLLSGIFENFSLPYLGMDSDRKPPEMAIYLSILKRSGIHRQTNNRWDLSLPTQESDVCNLLPSFKKIKEILEEEADGRINVAELINNLSLPPYGVRKGISPLLIAIFAVINEQHIAFYDRGVFMKEMKGLDIVRFTKVPELFEIQFCKIAGFRSEFFRKMLEVLGQHPEIGKHTSKLNYGERNVLDIVRPLCMFAAELPKYTLKTKRLSQTTLSTRNALLTAKEPAGLLFKELPLACGFPAVTPETSLENTEELVNTLKSCVIDLHRAYIELHERIFKTLVGLFELTENISISRARKELKKRSDNLLSQIKEIRLKGFCLQLADATLSDAEWLESLGSFVISIPPNNWLDGDEEKFIQELESIIERFARVENISFAKVKTEDNDSVLRLVLTRSDGIEVEKIIYSTKEELSDIENIKFELRKVLKNNPTIGIKALASAFWDNLAPNDT